MPDGRVRERPGRRRGAALLLLLLLVPASGVALLTTRPSLDVRWEHQPAHFWLVLGTAVLSTGLAYATGEAARRRGDARLLYVSLAFLSSAGFLVLHALATPGVLLRAPNVGFAIAPPVGVALGSVFALLSARSVTGTEAPREVSFGRGLRVVLVVLFVVWAVLSLTGLPPLSGPPTQAEDVPTVAAIAGGAFYLIAALRYWRLWRRRRGVVLIAVLAAYLLLAQALIAMSLARSWHASWWQWHLLLLAAFALVALAARRSWYEERFAALYLSSTTSGEREMSVLFADLEGFTSYSESHPPTQVTSMLNAYFAVAVPAVTREGGDVDRIVGDALMVTFSKRGDQPDHAVLAAQAGLRLQRDAAAVSARHPTWPRFRVGINTGPVTVSVLGTVGGRTHTVIGDTVNAASRIEGRAPVGQVAIGAATLAALPDAVTRPLGDLHLKGRSAPFETHVLLALGNRSRQHRT